MGVRSAQEILDEARAVVEPAHWAALCRLPEEIKQIAEYHGGWSASGTTPVRDRGKAIRPALTVLCSRGAGGTVVDDAVTAAVAVELVHDFSLLHDDVMDGDQLRRGRPSAWVRFGVGPTVLAGDTLLALAFDLLAHKDTTASWTEPLTRTVLELCHGQAMDLAFESREDVELAEALGMVDGKTGSLLGLACELGALAGGADRDRAAVFRGFGRELGRSFQLRDDMLGIWGDPAITGKPVYSDIAARKKSLPIVAALTSKTREGKHLATLLTKDGSLSGDDLRAAAELIVKSGARLWARLEAESSLMRALDLLPGLVTDTDDLTTLACLLSRRTK